MWGRGRCGKAFASILGDFSLAGGVRAVNLTNIGIWLMCSRDEQRAVPRRERSVVRIYPGFRHAGVALRDTSLLTVI